MREWVTTALGADGRLIRVVYAGLEWGPIMEHDELHLTRLANDHLCREVEQLRRDLKEAREGLWMLLYSLSDRGQKVVKISYSDVVQFLDDKTCVAVEKVEDPKNRNVVFRVFKLPTK